MYKYRILELLRKLPRYNEKQLRELLPEQIGVSPETFNSWLYIKADSAREIKAVAIFIIAEALQVEPIELFTNPPTIFTLEDMKESYEKSRNPMS